MLPLFGAAWGCLAEEVAKPALACRGDEGLFVTEVIETVWGPGQAFGRDRMPDVVLGPPRGFGKSQGSTDVVSLGNGGSIVVGFGAQAIVDGPGVDFVVFENAFEIAGGGIYAELGTVAVSDDGASWAAFPCDALEPPYGSCAGHHPVYLDGVEGPFDPESAGGDPFDLADVGLSRARYLRIVDREDQGGLAGVFDLDAVGIVHPACR
jgi:hypothetical protein